MEVRSQHMDVRSHLNFSTDSLLLCPCNVLGLSSEEKFEMQISLFFFFVCVLMFGQVEDLLEECVCGFCWFFFSL